ncbi:MAG TPA: peroxiredoxin-like family protein [Solirubrobacteraceae bacterium]|nr:peroxiredoxin-like family protein [Solirubrobacteraceae bacterium]
MHCRDHAVQLHRAREQLDEAGLKLVLIGQASPRQAAAFRRKTKIDLPVLADEERVTYRLANLRRGSLTQLVGPRSVLAGVKHSARSGVMQGRVIGDAAQLGGAMVIGPGDEVLFEQRSKNAGDTVEPEELLEAVR